MAFTCRETATNPYHQTSLHAAERDTVFESRLSAGAMIGIISTRLYQIERELREPHRDELIIMSDVYDAPELLTYCCAEMCLVGLRIRELKEQHK